MRMGLAAAAASFAGVNVYVWVYGSVCVLVRLIGDQLTTIGRVRFATNDVMMNSLVSRFCDARQKRQKNQQNRKASREKPLSFEMQCELHCI